MVGVFRHEMAHQLVAEQYSNQFETNRPHGELFKEACKRLGVPEQFARSGFSLQENNLDWRTETRDEKTEKILDKTKKLLALANSTNEHEAHLAMERVREIYAKYNLENMANASKESFVHLVITHGKKRMESWEQRTIGILTEHFFVKVLTFQQFNAKSLKTVHALEIIGSRQNVLMAEYVYHFLLQQVEFLLKQAGESGPGLARSEKASFRLGVLDGFDKKLQVPKPTDAKGSGTESETTLSVIGKALEIFRNDPRVDDYLSEIYPRLGFRRRLSLEIDTSAFAAGHTAGRSINLNKPISSSAGNQGKFLEFGK